MQGAGACLIVKSCTAAPETSSFCPQWLNNDLNYHNAHPPPRFRRVVNGSKMHRQHTLWEELLLRERHKSPTGWRWSSDMSRAKISICIKGVILCWKCALKSFSCLFVKLKSFPRKLLVYLMKLLPDLFIIYDHRGSDCTLGIYLWKAHSASVLQSCARTFLVTFSAAALCCCLQRRWKRRMVKSLFRLIWLLAQLVSPLQRLSGRWNIKKWSRTTLVLRTVWLPCKTLSFNQLVIWRVSQHQHRLCSSWTRLGCNTFPSLGALG